MLRPLTGLVVAVVVLAIAGCGSDENRRLAQMAERTLERQAAQEARNAELHREVAEGTKRLVEADALARKEIVELHRDVQVERTEFGKQRDQLEADRRDIAAARNRDPIVTRSCRNPSKQWG
jgi:fructose-specific phosphotransferase system component IIB